MAEDGRDCSIDSGAEALYWPCGCRGTSSFARLEVQRLALGNRVLGGKVMRLAGVLAAMAWGSVLQEDLEKESVRPGLVGALLLGQAAQGFQVPRGTRSSIVSHF